MVGMTGFDHACRNLPTMGAAPFRPSHFPEYLVVCGFRSGEEIRKNAIA